MDMITIRPLTLGDWEAWWPLRLRALQDHPDAFGSDYEEAVAEGEMSHRQRYVTSIGGKHRIFGALDADGRLVGCAGILGSDRRKLRHRMDVWGMYVTPEARGTGTGHRLIQACIDHARTVEGVLQVHLTVTTHNATASRLYERCGFQRYGREPRALVLSDRTAIDEDLMVLMLDSTS